MLIDALGWAAAVFGSSVALPQVIRLLRTKTTAGVSLMAWQLALGANISWVSHAVITGHLNILVPNLVLLICTVTILNQLRRDRGLAVLTLVGPGLLLAVVTVALNVTLGPVAFAIAAFLPSAIAQLAQFQDLVLIPNIRGVSTPFLAMSVMNQVLWVSWATGVGEVSVMLVGSSLGTLMCLNLVWSLLRRYHVVQARLALMSA
ncbi:MAG: PQ-loop domain-containing transporter [Propionibacteriaceae bacterium]